MVLPTLRIPQLLLFVEAASLLQDTSQVLLQAGQATADLPEVIAEAQARAEAQLQTLGIPAELRAQARGILRLTSPPQVLAYLQDLLDRGSGPDLEAFLEQAGSGSTLLRFPPLLVGAVALQVLLERLDFSPQEKAVLQAQRDQWEQALAELAARHKVSPEPLRAAAETALRAASAEELLQLGQDLFQDLQDLAGADSEPEAESQVELAGPLVFLMVADHLLAQTEHPLTPEQRLDLQINRAEAESRLLAMQKLGRLENLAEQRAYIRSWINQTSVPDLLRALDRFFAASEPNA
ncbi:hypothetical protein ACVW0Q_001647 [Thermostichus sp. MS-CIW-21]|jgi:hypothetical protein|uniref:hypothetical protein n=1 Tax=unclassified Synechococcus TaxID=2626047 RepID=UPI000C1935C7|nr:MULTISPECIES: hypothetical protein [unclassified Synechococcus]PIK87019.1 hypothetical protein SYN63AY4M2_11680 [Synechococcus sp. 63AY4M2]PIK96089.1 hypothetical protein SYN60AY4M2_12300 [Synechococcus sp. 60AY4M2]PIK98332.1 hypothetical protein SYN63AY4M1_09740 [Synechococcus sp. 63AY4M1]PIL00929.1 hypothetical protein SYN65AY640_04245 [Synechococcus sp. 65AY640]